MGDPTDQRLLTSGADGFETFYRRHVPVVHAYVARRTATAEQTLDIVAETFARALRARERFDPAQGAAAAWLIGIARNLLIDASRRGRVADETRRRLGMERIEVRDAFAAETDAAFDGGVLQTALAALPADQREAVILRIVDEQPYDAIAEQVGCSEQVVRKRVSRGLAAARRTIEEGA